MYENRLFYTTLLPASLVFTCSIAKMYIEAAVLNTSFDIRDRFKVRIYDNVIPHFLLVSTGAAINF